MYVGCRDAKHGWLGNFRKVKIHFREEGFHNLKTTLEKLKLYEKPIKYRKHKEKNKQGTLEKLTQTRRIPSMVSNSIDEIFPL
jgi:hypothetical protein